MEGMHVVGADVFIYSTADAPPVPPLPTEVGPLRLEYISNRGTKVWPETNAKLDYWADEWRCRYTTPEHTPTDRQALEAVLTALDDAGLEWTRLQCLSIDDAGNKLFSVAY